MGQGQPFVHLHTHTEFSTLDGAARVTDLVKVAVQDGQPALGITDHGNMYGVLDFYKACRGAGINPVIGTEAYMAAESINERPVRRGKVDGTGDEGEGGQKLYYHLTLLAESDQGYKNLLALSSAAYLEGYYYKPRVDWEMLDRHSGGLIATTGCLGGLVLQALLAEDQQGARAMAGRLQDIFGRAGLFVELQDHGLRAQQRTNPQLVRIARDLGAPLLATNDSHYTHREDASLHDALLCVQTGKSLDDPKRFKFEGEEHYLKSAAEMRHLFAELPDACDATLAVAERCRVTIEEGRRLLPEYPRPADIPSALAYLRQLTEAGARQRYGDPVPTDVRTRLDYELGVIADMDFADYFLVVADLVRHARKVGIRVGPGRGSAAGCCVAYCLRITDLDPIAYGLLFERFLNPGRKQMPDIDLDFDESRRDEMIRYAAETYGDGHVAQVVTFGRIGARAAVRDAARALLGKEGYRIGDQLSRAMPDRRFGRDTPLAACLTKLAGHEDGYEEAAALRRLVQTEPRAKEAVEVAQGLEGLTRSAGIHASAVVISGVPLVEVVPLKRDPGRPVVTQYDMHGVEALGLLKMDFLGLRNLTVIEHTTKAVEEQTGSRPDVDHLPLDDEATFELLQAGRTTGVFQLEGGPMRDLMRKVAPDCLADIAAVIALYRPGPIAAHMGDDYVARKHGALAHHLHPELAEVLEDTYGLMLYQESIMAVARHFAEYSLAEADDLRRAMSKKVRSAMEAERAKFVAGCTSRGYGAELGTQLFDVIEPFGDYAFNRSHAYAYALLAYQTAWLKAHHSAEYMAALLTSVGDDKGRAGLYLAECRTLGIDVAVPDVNASDVGFRAVVEDGEPARIHYGLGAIKGFADKAAATVVEERRRGGPYGDLGNFCDRVDPIALQRRNLEALVKAGGFDSLGLPRKGLLQALDEVVKDVRARRKREPARREDQSRQGGGGDHQHQVGIPSLFDLLREVEGPQPLAVPDVEFSRPQLLAFERELLGRFVSAHPLDDWAERLDAETTTTTAALSECRHGQSVRIGGLVTAVKRLTTRHGDRMARLTIEDLTGASTQVVVFPRVWARCATEVALHSVLVVAGRVQVDEGSLFADRIKRLDGPPPGDEGDEAGVQVLTAVA